MSHLSREAEYQLRKAKHLLAQRAEQRALLRERAAQAARVLKEEFGASRVWVFGSLNQAWFHEGSDLDLAVEGIAPSRMSAAWSRGEELVGGSVDLISFEEADPSLWIHIVTQGELLG